MRWFRRIVRAVSVGLLLLAVVLPASVFVVLSTPWAQDFMCRQANERLSELLGVPVRIDGVIYRPFNTLSLRGVHVQDPAGKPCLEAAAVSARFELWYFLRSGHLVFDYAVIEAPAISLYRDTPDSPLNIQPIIDRLKKPDTGRPPTHFELKIGTAIITHGRLCYDVLNRERTPGRLDPTHLKITDLNLYGYVRKITENSYDLEVESMSMREQSGLEITDLYVDAGASPSLIELRGLSLRLPGTYVRLAPTSLEIDGYGNIGAALRTHDIVLRSDGACRVSLRDLGWAVPALREDDHNLNLDFDAEGSLTRANLKSLHLTDDHGLSVEVSGAARGFTHPDSLIFDLQKLRLSAPGTELAALAEPFSPQAAKYLGRCGEVRIEADGSGSLSDMRARLDLRAAGGEISADGHLLRPRDRTLEVDGTVLTDGIDLGALLPGSGLETVNASVSGNATIRGAHATTARAEADIVSARYNGYTYNNIKAEATLDGREVEWRIESADPNADFAMEGSATDAGSRALDATVHIRRIVPDILGLTASRHGYILSGDAKVSLTGRNIDEAEGDILISDLAFVPADSTGHALKIGRFDLRMDRSAQPARFTLESDILNGSLEGSLTPSTLAATLRDMAAHSVPALLDHDLHLHDRLSRGEGVNDFAFDFTLDKAEPLCEFLGLPVAPIYPVKLEGSVNSTDGQAYVLMDAPYLRQGDKIIENTIVQASLDAREDRADVYLTTKMPTKKGPMTAVVDVDGALSRFDTSISWVIDRKIPINGDFNFSTEVGRDESGRLSADTRFNPGEITFGDDVWRIAPSRVDWRDGRLSLDGFGLESATQSIVIDGVAGPAEDDVVKVSLKDIQLASIFETLEIDKALIGGRATGEFTAAAALSDRPRLYTDGLRVKDIGYNYCTLGDAVVRADFVNESNAFRLDADITNPEGQHSRIWGDILAGAGALDLNFDARHIRVGFMKPFMEAFASDVQGYVSGRAHLFGSFKDIDMEGDVFADDLRLKIDFTNTWFCATDSIHIRPGLIDLKDITITDPEGHKAVLNGWLRHDYFHNPVFDFRVSGARDLLCYDVTPKLNPDWYGTIYANGSARVAGRPGVVEIGVDMRTAPHSTFTFVLSDRLEAEQYSFLTFRDKTEITVNDTLTAVDTDDTPAAVRAYRARMDAAAQDRPSDYLMDIKMDITPDAQLIIVMDPVGGDRIKAYGAGDMRMTYESADNDLRMYGTYTLDRGSYNFTLQDIIIKDFTIDPGSSITFRGDPYSAQLDIDAVYSVNANLSDLDESFLQDKDLNRTNVPVQALLKVTGDMRQPEIAFDLRFPTLTSDVYRKVRSIISTDEMMNRQIIYLLALNRFYTPDYMNATRGSELFSVASSTISSQLSSMLGKLSENWSIAPNLRSDRGDFSDVEVDLALSSRLLNNRLLFNGNFGYRDNTLNTSQFIGDFDIEYLLNPRGTWRLKAYNRYNDQNYYVRTAATTQGVGIMFRRDFDNLFGFLRPKKRRQEAPDSVKPRLTDTITNPIIPQ